MNKGKKKEKKTTVLLKKRILLAQSEIHGNSKDLKYTDASTIESSFIHSSNVYSSSWTINDTHLALYSELGVKIFSLNEEDLKSYPSSYLQTLQYNHN